jgi:protein-S-isoprenylcysteine O-methyltransferase Ste14
MSSKRRLLTPAVWVFYIVIVLEFLFMISPIALHFYASYGPVLNVLHASPWTAWLTGFFLPHFSHTTSPLLDGLKPVGFWLAGAGLLLFLVGAIHIYGAKLLRRPAVTGGLYRLVRHPQYLALAILGLGTTLIWPRYIVLFSYLLMLLLYGVLARWEETRCLEQYGDSYRDFVGRTGRFVPRQISGPIRRVLARDPESESRTFAGRTLLRYAVVATLTVSASLGLREYSLGKITSRFDGPVAILSPAVLTDAELERAYRIAVDDPETRHRLSETAPESPLLAYVVPGEWFLPDLPLHSEEEIRRVGGGHSTPIEFDRGRFKVLFTRARTHLDSAMGRNIVRWSYGHDPVTIVWIDMKASQVLRHEEPPRHVIWGDIPTPLF